MTIYDDIRAERERQEKRWGRQDHPAVEEGLHNGFETYAEFYKRCADQARAECDAAGLAGELTWRHIAKEEFYEALAETDPTKRRVELVQLAAVVVACIESEDRKFRPVQPPKPKCNSCDDTGQIYDGSCLGFPTFRPCGGCRPEQLESDL